MKHPQITIGTAEIQPPFNIGATDLSDLLCVSMPLHASPCFPMDQINRDLIDAGASLHWLHVKAKNPVDARWSELPNRSESDLRRSYRPGLNIGIRLGQFSQIGGDFLHLVDLDIRDASKAGEAWAALLALWPAAKGFPSVVSGSGGESRHLYFLSPVAMPKRNLAKSVDFITIGGKRKRAWEIDLMGTGSQAVLPPSIHPDTGQPYYWENPLELDFPLSMWINAAQAARFGAEAVTGAADDDDDLLFLEQVQTAKPHDLTAAQVAEILGGLPADWVEDRDHWLTTGAALHHQFQGQPEGFEAWCEWSKASAKFDRKDAARVWKSFKGSKKPVTIATLRKAANWAAPEAAEYHRLKNGELIANGNNTILVLSKVNAERQLEIRHNEMTGRNEWCAGPINDSDLTAIRVYIEKAGMPKVAKGDVPDAVQAVARVNRFHPVRDWLDSLHHDGKPRLDSWLARYFRADDSPLTRAIGRAFLVAMVARVMRPGCKHDHVLVLQGAQGIGKSTACRILGGEWTGDNMPSIQNDKEAGLWLRGHWLVEMAELVPSRHDDQEALKAFITRGSDEIRAPYGKIADIVPRQCVFVGTTNEAAFLRDASGGRRFWPVACGAQIDTEGLASDREQLFAEAVAAFRAGELWHLSPDMEQQAKALQESVREEHAWEQPIRDYLEGLGLTEGDGFDRQPKDSVTIGELLTRLGIPVERQPGKASREVARLLRMFGWERSHTMGGKRWVRG